MQAVDSIEAAEKKVRKAPLGAFLRCFFKGFLRFCPEFSKVLLRLLRFFYGFLRFFLGVAFQVMLLEVNKKTSGSLALGGILFFFVFFGFAFQKP